ncbi:MAG: hypothetical protein A2Z14_07835 [Chloroflexi bacterium RBG_16_48_8]|nr:MAG: hypothetical protein A2Z14_07835 [Chloroflexi bacterium RBG_16_48_8]
MVLAALQVREKQNLRRQLEDARARYGKGVEGLNIVKNHREKLLRGYGCDSWGVFEESIERFHKLQIDLEMAETTLAALLDKDDTPSTLLERRKRASRGRRDLQEQLDEFAHTPELSPIEFQKLVSAIERLGNESKGCQEQILKLEALSETGGATLEDLHCLEEQP